MFVLISKLGTSNFVRTLTWMSTGEGKQVIEDKTQGYHKDKNKDITRIKKKYKCGGVSGALVESSVAAEEKG